jgi:phosphoribosyl 1,2-cyclic phosphate phosphodiesterase
VNATAIVLGSGTSNGVPTLGVDYKPEFLANPKNHRTRPSLLLMGPTGNLLVDCAPEMRLQLLRENIKMVEAVLITHTHADHIMGMDDLRSFCLRSKQDMPVYAGPEAQNDIKRIFPYAFEDHVPGIEVPRYDLRDVPETLTVGGMPIQTMWVQHGKMSVVAIRLGGFAYVTDVSEIPPPAWAKLQGLSTLILDGVRYKPHPNHFHYDKAIEVAQALGATKTYLTHLSHDYDHDVTNAELPPEIELAYDGLKIPLTY